MMKPWQDHKWVATPHTRTERRWALNIYRPTQTVWLNNQRYLNIDTGKYDSDRLPTLYHSSLAEMAVPESHDYGCQDSRHTRADRYYSRNERWFTPKDDDFDEEIEREERERAAKIAAEEKVRMEKAAAEKEIERAKMEEYRQYLKKQQEEERERNAAVLRQANEMLKRVEEDRLLAEIQERLRQLRVDEQRIKDTQDLRRRIAHQMQCNVRPNRWVPK